MDREDVFKFIVAFILLVIVLSIGAYVHYLGFVFDIWLAPVVFWIIVVSAVVAFYFVNESIL
ncbi:hypothetical protein [Bacillus pumilus]|uniref:hypothetical protein n=1 Tax=Bacillus pumilus TaxID=1408 RepID=UPI003D08A371